MMRAAAIAHVGLLCVITACPSESVPERLVITPDPLDVSDAEGWLERPVTVRVDDAQGDELTSTVVEPSRKVVEAELSPSSRFFYVRGAERGGEAFVTVHDARRAERSCRIALPSTGPGTARFGWTPGDNLLLTWSAGTYAAEAVLHDTGCDELLGLSAPAIEVAPGRGTRSPTHRRARHGRSGGRRARTTSHAAFRSASLSRQAPARRSPTCAGAKGPSGSSSTPEMDRRGRSRSRSTSTSSGCQRHPLREAHARDGAASAPHLRSDRDRVEGRLSPCGVTACV